MQIFMKDHQDLYYFSTHDQLRLLKGFDSLVLCLENPRDFKNKLRA